jgi:hypothetical protein
MGDLAGSFAGIYVAEDERQERRNRLEPDIEGRDRT